MHIRTLQLQTTDRQRLQALGVSVVYLFGSHAEGLAQAGSDVDVGIVLRDPGMLAASTNALYVDLFALFSEHLPNSDDLDLVFLQKAPLELQYDVIVHGLPLFSRSETMRLDFEERTMLAYCDFHPLRAQFNAAMLDTP